MFHLPIFLITILPKPRRRHRYARICEAALSEKYSASNIKVFSVDYTRKTAYLFAGIPISKVPYPPLQ